MYFDIFCFGHSAKIILINHVNQVSQSLHWRNIILWLNIWAADHIFCFILPSFPHHVKNNNFYYLFLNSPLFFSVIQEHNFVLTVAALMGKSEAWDGMF